MVVVVVVVVEWWRWWSDYFNYQKMYAKTEFMSKTAKYNPFHTNNFSFAVGGPVIPHNQFFFFFAAEPQRSAASTGNQLIKLPDAEFEAFALANFPNTFGTKILNTYAPSTRDHQRRIEDGKRHFPRHMRNSGNQQFTLRYGHD